MVKIYLTKREKALLRAVAQGECPEREWSLSTLQDKGLIRTAREEGGGIVDASLTSLGREYLAANPKLKNPVFAGHVNWAAVSAIGCSIWAVLSLLLLFFILGIL